MAPTKIRTHKKSTTVSKYLILLVKVAYTTVVQSYVQIFECILFGIFKIKIKNIYNDLSPIELNAINIYSTSKKNEGFMK